MQQDLRACLRERAELEAKKNDLQNTLTNNLLKTKADLERELEEISMSEKAQQLEMTSTELSHLDGTIVQNQRRYGGNEVWVCLNAFTRVIYCLLFFRGSIFS